MKIAFSYAFNSSVPIMTRSVIDQLRLVILSTEQAVVDPEVEHLVQLIDVDQYSGLLQLIDTLFGRYEMAMQKEQNKVILAFRSMEDSLIILQESLTDFNDINHISKAENKFLL